MSAGALLMALMGTGVLIATYLTWRTRDLPRIRREQERKGNQE